MYKYHNLKLLNELLGVISPHDFDMGNIGLVDRGMTHTRGAPYHPQTQGKIERYHRSIKNVVNLQHYYLPGELEQEIARFVEYYNNHRYHESLDNLTPADVYEGRAKEQLSMRESIKQLTMKSRKNFNHKKGDYTKRLDRRGHTFGINIARIL